MSAAKQVSHARNVFLFRVLQINLQIVLGGRRGGLMMSLVCMTAVSGVVSVQVLVLEPLSTLGENVEIKSSG